ncbi:uncharacterized protein RMCC_1576 [Mycolicibacterium canariasense]|uniref:Uncharacterized protein n=1 Tax=Mycolicibacterium canariasense TaxID=228230 RepID=A0A117I9E9_MYCCR|nr:hypothetical protein [Mycolicibacterium canariasense]MCV7208604.1 hypothetical protein [Mycolicibacterium canariasense]ORV07305.1 hypothetical protein AWB94_15105 [Mycolicibacterium canariasense]GAS94610.1 uncharacterized protein RMCC_1576 [Mycolicibacterium canariasense]
MSTAGTPSAEELAAVFAYAGLTVSPERMAENYPTYSSTLAVIRQASAPVLGETVPAVGFTASWD